MDVARYLSDPLAFYREEIILDTGDRFGDVAAPWQLELLRQIEEGAERFLWCEAPRGYAKTSLLAMVALRRLILGSPGQRIYAAAGDRDQARILLDALAEFVRNNPRLADGLSVSAYRAELAAKGNVLEALAADAPTSWGLKPSLVLLDEVTVWRRRELLDSLISATGKVQGARLLAITNAGTLGSWQDDLRKAIEPDADWHFLHLEPGLAPWISESWIESQRRILPPPTFERVILNRWGSGEGNFFTPEQIDLAVVAAEDFNPELFRHAMTKVAIGVDLGVRADATAVAAVGVNAKGQAGLLELAVFQPEPGAEVSLENVETCVEEMHRRWHSGGVVFDPHQGRLMLQRLAGRVPVEEHAFTASSVEKLSKILFERISQGLLRFPSGVGRSFVAGQEWNLERELRELQYLQTSYGFRFDHRTHGFSDRVTAVALALWKLAGESLGPVLGITDDDIGAGDHDREIERRAENESRRSSYRRGFRSFHRRSRREQLSDAIEDQVRRINRGEFR